MVTTKKRGRPSKKPDAQTQAVQAIKEVIKFVDKPQLEGYELYKSLRDLNFPQGGGGHWLEDPNGLEKVYVPEVSEVYGQFIMDPAQWEEVRDALCREWIRIK